MNYVRSDNKSVTLPHVINGIFAGNHRPLKTEGHNENQKQKNETENEIFTCTDCSLPFRRRRQRSAQQLTCRSRNPWDPQLGFLISSDNEDNWNPIDLALSVGASYVIPATGFGIDLKYNHGLNDINKSSDVISTNRGIQLGLFYLFGHDAERTIRNL